MNLSFAVASLFLTIFQTLSLILVDILASSGDTPVIFSAISFNQLATFLVVEINFLHAGIPIHMFRETC